MRQFYTWKELLGCAKLSGINVRILNINTASIKAISKNQKTTKNWAKQPKNVLKWLSICSILPRRLFKVKKLFTERSAWSKNFSRLANTCSEWQPFSILLLDQNSAWTKVLAGKKHSRRIPETTQSHIRQKNGFSNS